MGGAFRHIIFVVVFVQENKKPLLGKITMLQPAANRVNLIQKHFINEFFLLH